MKCAQPGAPGPAAPSEGVPHREPSGLARRSTAPSAEPDLPTHVRQPLRQPSASAETRTSRHRSATADTADRNAFKWDLERREGRVTSRAGQPAMNVTKNLLT